MFFQAVAAEANPEAAIQPTEEAVMSEEVIKKVGGILYVFFTLVSCFFFQLTFLSLFTQI